jgi:hypothetical protein
MLFPEARLPKMVQEAVDHVIAASGREEKELIRTSDLTDLGQYHFGLGTGIKEVFHLWHGNKELLKSCGSDEMHPDDAALVIIEALRKGLQTRH